MEEQAVRWNEDLELCPESFSYACYATFADWWGLPAGRRGQSGKKFCFLKFYRYANWLVLEFVLKCAFYIARRLLLCTLRIFILVRCLSLYIWNWCPASSHCARLTSKFHMLMNMYVIDQLYHGCLHLTQWPVLDQKSCYHILFNDCVPVHLYIFL